VSLITLCRATPRDVDAVLADVQAGFDSYLEFAPGDWSPPDMSYERERILDLLGSHDTCALLAMVGEDPVGHVSFFPARERVADEMVSDWRERALIPGLAHFWQLFVLPAWWGRGVAQLLHDAAITEMSARRYVRARLYTPTEHARARHFYERRGWVAVEDVAETPLGLGVTEYRLELREAMARGGGRGSHRRSTRR
jgi:GNAT superfamily N-acetyltransferase